MRVAFDALLFCRLGVNRAIIKKIQLSGRRVAGRQISEGGINMNYVFISPNFPRGYSNFAVRLKAEGVNVLGLGQDKYDELNNDLKRTLTEYYRVENMEKLR